VGISNEQGGSLTCVHPTSKAAGTELAESYFLAGLAEALSQAGQSEEGVRVLAEALAQIDRTGERRDEAELYRLKGQLRLQKLQVPRPTFHSSPLQAEVGAEECFWKASEIARRQHAKSLELRATVSLAHLWQRQDKTEDAHQTLAAIYGWFTARCSRQKTCRRPKRGSWSSGKGEKTDEETPSPICFPPQPCGRASICPHDCVSLVVSGSR